jgi:hypothetical protein
MQWVPVQTGAAAANAAGMILAVPAAPPAEFVEDIGQRAPPVLQSPHGRSACMHEAVRPAPPGCACRSLIPRGRRTPMPLPRLLLD